jgi:hypothetical protein
MGFQISAHGTREGVLKHVSAAKALPENSDQGQIEACKSLIVSEINALPTEFNGCRVEAQGDATKGSRTFQLTIIPAKLHL